MKKKRKNEPIVRQLLMSEMATLRPERFRELLKTCDREEGFIRPVDAAGVLGVSRQYVSELIREGKLRTWMMGGGKFVSMREVDELNEDMGREAG